MKHKAVRCLWQALLLWFVWLPLTAAAEIELPVGRPAFGKLFIQPHVRRIEFVDGDVWLNGRFRITGDGLVGNAWSFDPAVKANYIVEPVELDPASPPAGCSPATAVPAEKDGVTPWALACQGPRWLFAWSGYCPEGEERTGQLLLMAAEGQGQALEQVIPECNSPVAGVLRDATAWIGTEYPLENDDPAGGALLEVLLSEHGVAKVERHLAGEVLTAVALSPDQRFLWVATRSGIHRLDLQSRQWEHGYFRYRLAANDNSLVLYLADAPLAAADYELWAALLALPILDRRDFVESWRIVPPDFSWYRYGTSTALWPHYRDALFALVERPEADRRSWRGSSFPLLLDLVLGPSEVAPARKLSIIKRLLAEELNGEYRRSLVAKLHQPNSATLRFNAAEFAAAGIDVEALQAEASLYLLLSSSPRPDSEEFSQLCWLIVEDENIAKRFWALVGEGS
ncbi:MAG TPA: hypothetical protein VFY81_08845, partial [Gammaproteobacteria bacterium]|nr:hypothetical protein [Gammaproteobacteria bacterium]